MASESLTIFGTAVSCVQCLTLITGGLKPLDGIKEISADTQTNVLIIDYDTSIISEDSVRGKLRSLGFGGKQLYCIC